MNDLRAAFAGMLVLVAVASPAAANENSREAARGVLDAFMAAWNQSDNVALRQTLNYPMLSHFGTRFVVAGTAEEFAEDFDGMREREGWVRSSFDSVTVTSSSPEKVHFRVVYSRYGADDEPYVTAGVFYAVTKQNDHWGVQYRGLGRAPEEPLTDEQAAAESAARATVLDFFTAFNAGDNAGVRDRLNFPHAFLVGNGNLIAAMDDSGTGATMDFDAMREREGWYMSSLDSMQPVVVSAATVAYELVFGRYRANGVRYRSVPALWVLTREGGHWGIQFRSLMPPTFTGE